MKTFVVIITETDTLARTLDRCLTTAFGNSLETRFMTYHKTQLSGTLLKQTDLFIFELLSFDALGERAAGIYAAEKFASAQKRSLLISDRGESESAGSKYYWDTAARDHLPERILTILKSPPPNQEDFTALKKIFATFCRPPYDRHGQ